jgi:hypothetical protein
MKSLSLRALDALCLADVEPCGSSPPGQPITRFGNSVETTRSPDSTRKQPRRHLPHTERRARQKDDNCGEGAWRDYFDMTQFVSRLR